MKTTIKIIGKILNLFIIVSLIFIIIIIYNKYNYNSFYKNVKQKHLTEFTRDSEIKYNDDVDSYKIENKDYNDSAFYEKIQVEPNTPYKIVCMVKTKDVESVNDLSGAHISILGTTEHSKKVKGTKDWQQLVLYINSKNRTQLNVGFRLGEWDEEAKGTAWFSNFKIEKGNLLQDKKWKFGCFIFPNLDVNVDVNGKNEHVKLKMSEDDVKDIKSNMQRFKNGIKEISHNKMEIDYDIHIINEPIKTLSYDKINGYYVAEKDVYDLINKYVEKNEYDHIYVGFRMADKQKGKNILENDWIGLGGMDYLGIGFSNIRIPDDNFNYAYKYNTRFNTFPEEVFLHEFLHTLERNSKEFGYEIPALHDNEKYGYKEEKGSGLKKWYEDYMNKEIVCDKIKIGIPSEIYNYKPVNEKNFQTSLKLQAFEEPKNIIEVIKSLYTRIIRLFKYKETILQ